MSGGSPETTCLWLVPDNNRADSVLMRSSIVPARVSALAAQPLNPASLHRLLEKKKEYETVAALERASALFVKRIEGLANDCQVMADAGQGESAHAWNYPVLIALDRSPRPSSRTMAQHVPHTRTLSCVSATHPSPELCSCVCVVANRQQYAESEASLADLESAPGERLVRIPLDEVSAGNARPS